MLTYIYETTDPSKPRREIEVRQSIHDDPLVVDPQTGEAVRRIISAGYQILSPAGRSDLLSVRSVLTTDKYESQSAWDALVWNCYRTTDDNCAKKLE